MSLLLLCVCVCLCVYTHTHTHIHTHTHTHTRTHTHTHHIICLQISVCLCASISLSLSLSHTLDMFTLVRVTLTKLQSPSLPPSCTCRQLVNANSTLFFYLFCFIYLFWQAIRECDEDIRQLQASWVLVRRPKLVSKETCQCQKRPFSAKSDLMPPCPRQRLSETKLDNRGFSLGSVTLN